MHYARMTELALAEGLVESDGLTPDAGMRAQLGTDIKRRLRHRLSETDPQAFEHLIAELLTALGFDGVEVTKYSGDGGIDVWATLTVGGVTDVRTAVPVKRWANNVFGKTVRELRGGLGPHERGLIITLSDFTRDARAEAAATDRTPITLIGGDQLIDLPIDNGIGVTARAVSILQLDEDALVQTEEETPHHDTNLGHPARKPIHRRESSFDVASPGRQSRVETHTR